MTVERRRWHTRKHMWDRLTASSRIFTEHTVPRRDDNIKVVGPNYLVELGSDCLCVGDQVLSDIHGITKVKAFFEKLLVRVL